MGFFSRLFGLSSSSPQSSGAAQPESVFQIPWYAESSTGDRELRDAYVLLSDVEGLMASDIAPIREKCKQAGRSLVLVTPGMNGSIFPLLEEGDTVAIKAAGLPGQPVRGLLQDVAIITGGIVLHKELGFGLSFPELPSSTSQLSVCIPRHALEDLTLGELGRVRRLIINRDGTELHGPAPRRQDVQARTIHLLREAPTPGRDERLRRLCMAAGCLPDKAKVLASLHTDFSAEYPLGLASPYFVTDPNTMECRLEDAYVAVLGEPLKDLELLVRLLGQIAAAGRPLLTLAPSVSDEALAICVVNKLRGILQCAVAISRTPSEDPGTMLAEIAGRTGAQVVTQAEARRSQGQGFLGRAATVRATSNGITVTPARQ